MGAAVWHDWPMKVRIGVGWGGDPGDFGDTVDQLERAGVDSLWLSEVVFSAQVEPFVGMAHALGRTRKLKVGTGVTVLPGRHPVLVAKQLVSLAALAPGRVLPAFGLRPARDEERQVFVVPTGRRAAVFDESLRLLRLLLSGSDVTFRGEFYQVEHVGVGPVVGKPLDLWLGGSAPAALDRVGRLADGWLGSFVDPEGSRAARLAIQAAASEAGREIEEDHFGLSLGVAFGDVPDGVVEVARRRQPGADPADLVADGWGGLARWWSGILRVGLRSSWCGRWGRFPMRNFWTGLCGRCCRCRIEGRIVFWGYRLVVSEDRLDRGESGSVLGLVSLLRRAAVALAGLVRLGTVGAWLWAWLRRCPSGSVLVLAQFGQVGEVVRGDRAVHVQCQLAYGAAWAYVPLAAHLGGHYSHTLVHHAGDHVLDQFGQFGR